MIRLLLVSGLIFVAPVYASNGLEESPDFQSILNKPPTDTGEGALADDLLSRLEQAKKGGVAGRKALEFFEKHNAILWIAYDIENWPNRIQALDSLGRIGNPAAIPLILDALERDVVRQKEKLGGGFIDDTIEPIKYFDSRCGHVVNTLLGRAIIDVDGLKKQFENATDLNEPFRVLDKFISDGRAIYKELESLSSGSVTAAVSVTSSMVWQEKYKDGPDKIVIKKSTPTNSGSYAEHKEREQQENERAEMQSKLMPFVIGGVVVLVIGGYLATRKRG